MSAVGETGPARRAPTDGTENADAENARTERGRAENARVERALTENARAQRGRTEKGRAEGSRVEGSRVETGRPEASRVEASHVDTGHVDAGLDGGGGGKGGLDDDLLRAEGAPRSGPRDGGRSPVDHLLESAGVLLGAYPPQEARRRLGTVGAPPPEPSRERPAPDLFPSAHEQSRHDLNLAVALVVDAPQAAVGLARLLDADGGDPHGALVFGALLHLTRAEDAAAHWWRYAADGGNRTAAFCLYLLHSSRAEFRDAAHWRERARRTAPPPRHPAGTSAPPGLSPSLRHRLLAQCHARRNPSLPAALESVINRLPLAPGGEDGEVPLPDASLQRLLGPGRGPG